MGLSKDSRLLGSQPNTLAQVRDWIGWAVDDVHGARIGRLEDVVADRAERLAEWLVVNEFRFGQGRRFLIPAGDATGSGGRVWVPYQRDLIHRSVGLGWVRRSASAEQRLRAHYSRSARGSRHAA